MAVGDVLRGERVTLRWAGPGDAVAVHTVLSGPGVVERWLPTTLEAVADDLVEDPTFVVFLILVGDEVAGIVQYGIEAEPQYRHASIDVAVVAEHRRQGVATDAIGTLARHLFDDLGHHRITIDPAADNDAAIACYERLGFRRVGVLRRYELGPDGTFHDGLLLDLLAGELQ